MKTSSKIESYFEKQVRWLDGMKRLRKAMIDLGYKEEVKWGMPTYTMDGKNLIGLAGFKNHFGIWFHQGVFLSDPLNLLTNAQEGKTKGMRHIKFFDSKEVDIKFLKPYLKETIKNHKEGKVIKSSPKTSNYEMPPILKAALQGNVKTSFENISASKQNEYIEYIATAKRESTQKSRIEKIVPMILKAEGLNDMYK